MAEKLCTLRTRGGGGGRYNETSLWTNSSPTSNFGGQDVTLSESIDNFKYIAVKFKSTTTSSSDSQMATVIYKVEDVKKATNPSAALQPVSAFGNLNSGNTNYNYRYIVYKGSTTLFIANAYSINASGSNNALAIPLEILGLNELDHGKNFDESVLWTNSNPTDSSGFANQDVTLSDSLTDYDYVKIRCAYAYNDTGSTFESVYSVSEFVKTSAPATFGFTGCSSVTHRSNGYFYDRRVIYKNATSITFGSCMGYKAGTAAATSNIFNIPLQIIGCKFR